MIPKIHRLSNLVCLNILLLMIIVACSTKPQPGTPTQIAAVDVTNCELANVAGEVEIFPAQSSSSKIASDTTAVQCGDEILLKSGSSAELYCGNLDPQYLVAGITFTVNCTSGKIPTMPCYADQGCRGFATGHGVGSPEREGTIQIPYVIEPRATLLLEQPKILRWNPVDGASEYEVTVRGRDLRWVTTTTESEVVYTGDPFLPGVDYTFEVTTFITDETGEALRISSQDEGQPGLSFALLSAKDVAHFQKSFDNIQQTSPSSTERIIAEYNLYLSYGLNLAAIHLLEREIDSSETNPVLIHLQGQAYRNVALLKEAESAYSLALEQAAKLNDLNVIGQSNTGLGLLLCGADGVDQAGTGIDYLETALSTYEQLGYVVEINRLNKEIETCYLSDN